MKKLQTEVLVIGGGATGAGVAWDLAMRGFNTILVEKGDLTHGTTGRYHGLLHSGGRYVVKDPQAAIECIEENRILRKILPGCIEDTGGFFVVTPADDPAYAPRFVEGCKKAGIPVEEVSIGQMLREEPLLNPMITHCFRVPDGSADAFAATDLNARAAAALGGRILTYHRVERLLTDSPAGLDDQKQPRRVTGALCHDLASGEEVEIFADLTVNASGAWAGKIAASAGIKVHIVGGKGTMVAMNHRIVHTVINRCKMPSDGDILVPAHTVSVIGTTDVKIDDPDHFGIEPWEIHLCLEEGDQLVPGFKEMRMLRAWAGVRPLYQETAVTDTRDVTRAFVLLDHEARDGVAGLVTITSGKWTTYRKMAEVTVDLVCKKLGTERSCRTHLEAIAVSTKHGYHHLGDRLAKIEEQKAYGELVCECELATRADVERAIRENGAKTLDDIRRDVRLGMGPCQGGFCTYRAAGILHETTQETPDRGEPILTQNINAALRDFLQERWKGLLPILWGQQLRQEYLDEYIYLSLLNADHLPGPERTPLAPEMYAPINQQPKNLVREAKSYAEPRATTGGDAKPERLVGSFEPVRASLDVVVIGGGLTGLVSAWQAAGRGKRVRLITKGWGLTHWGPGCLDVLGYFPLDDPSPLESPRQGLRRLLKEEPEHPYTLVGVEMLEESLTAISKLCAQSGYPLEGSLDRNWLLPSALGVARPTCLAPATMIAGDLHRKEAITVIGIQNFPDFYPTLIADNLRQQGYTAEAVQIDLDEIHGRRFITGRVLAGLFQQAEFLQSVVKAIKRKSNASPRLAFPAVLGIEGAVRVKAYLEAELQAEIFEIPTLPPSIPGMRLHKILLDAIQSLGGQVYEGHLALHAEAKDGKITRVHTEAAAREKGHSATSFILATGGILGGGIISDYSGRVRETVFDLPVDAPESREKWFTNQFLHPQGQPIFQAGVRINSQLQPVAEDESLLYSNVYIAGSAARGGNLLRERSIDGVAVTSGYIAGNRIP